jgi:hypothetical protein
MLLAALRALGDNTDSKRYARKRGGQFVKGEREGEREGGREKEVKSTRRLLLFLPSHFSFHFPFILFPWRFLFCSF